jgi:putative ABC transport system permease protein
MSLPAFPPLRPIVSALLRRKTGPLLIALQVALTLAILCNALFIVQQRLQQAAAPSGVAEEEVFKVSVVTPGYDDTPFDIQRRDEGLIRAVPGVVAASWANQVPLTNSGSNGTLSPERKSGSGQGAALYRGSTQLVSALGLKLVQGRDFLPAEEQDIDRRQSRTEPGQIIITQALAKALFPGEAQAVGRTVYHGTGADDPASTVVGVVEHLVSPWGPASWNRGDPQGVSNALLPARTEEIGHYIVRTEPGRLAEVRAAVVAALKQSAPGRIVLSEESMLQVREDRYRDDTYLAGLMTVVIGLLLTMTAAGIVGLASLWVTQRRKQIGVRRALGARRSDIVGHFLAENLMITTAGTALGLTLAVALNHVLTRFTSLQPLPGAALAVGAAVMLCLGALAVLVPALRAARVPPAEATRSV